MSTDCRSSKDNGVMLKDASPDMVAKLIQHFEELGAKDVAQQLDQLFVERQILGGEPDSFSFLAYPLPRLTFEQRQTADFRDEESLYIDLQAAHIKIDLDNFGKINWFYVSNFPELYYSLRKFMLS